MKHKQIQKPNRTHSDLLSTFSELKIEQVAVLLDCVLHATVDTGYIESDTVNEIKDALSATLAFGVIYQEAI